jgi:hypothetical protein
MIKRFFSVISIIALGVVVITLYDLISTPVVKTDILPNMETRSLSEHGIEIISPGHPTYSALMTDRLQKIPNVDIETFKRSSVFIDNGSGRSIAALTVKWELLQPDGKSFVFSRGRGGALGVVSDGQSAHLMEDIAPKGNRLFSLLGFSDDAHPRFNLRGNRGDIARQLSESVKVTISVDGVLFADGAFVGPDTNKNFEKYKAEAEAWTTMLTEVAEGLNGNEEAMRRIELLAEGKLKGTKLPSGEDASQYQMMMQGYARRILSIRARSGDKAVLDGINAELSKPRISFRKL